MFAGGSMTKLYRESVLKIKSVLKADDAVAVRASFVKRNDRLSHKIYLDL